jgi:phenylacetate-coenzyme A ligase PaaK-like adenylate-forming protein
VSAATLDPWMAARMGLAAPLTREAIAAWRLARLNETIAHARVASPFYLAKRDWSVGTLATIEDLARLPFTTAADLIANDPPLLALSQSAVARVVTLETSGTSGPPKRLHFTPDDLESTIDFFHHGMALLARPGDRAAIAFPGRGPGGVAAGLVAALRRLGAVPVAAPSPLDPVALAAWLREARPDVVAGPPVPLLAAARVAAADGGAPIRARAVLLSSDHVAASVARALAAAWGAEVFRHWGMTETGYGGAVDCAFHCGCHLREDELFVEIVDPGTGASAPAGAVGEVVVSTLRRRAAPLLRYRTGDLARLIEAPCACGSALRRLAGFAGRVGAGASLPSGGELTLPQLDEALFAVEAVSDFAAVVEMGAPATLTLSIAAPKPLRLAATLEAARARLAEDPVIGAALQTGALRVEVAFADVAAFSSRAKRRLTIREAAPCAQCC